MTSQWRHRNKTHSWYSELNSLQNVYFGIFYIWKINRMTLFCNLFIERPSYFTYLGKSPRWMDWNESLQCCRSWWRNHGRQVQIWKYQGFWCHQGSKFALSHWLWTWALPQCSTTMLFVISTMEYIDVNSMFIWYQWTCKHHIYKFTYKFNYENILPTPWVNKRSLFHFHNNFSKGRQIIIALLLPNSWMNYGENEINVMKFNSSFKLATPPLKSVAALPCENWVINYSTAKTLQ